MISVQDVDLRRIARFLAVLTPISLIVSAQEFVMTGVALLFLAQCVGARDFSFARQHWFLAFLALWIWSLVRTLFGHPTLTGLLLALSWIHLPIFAAALAEWVLPDERTRRLLLITASATVAFFGADIILQGAIGHDIVGRKPFPGDHAARMTSVFSKPGVGAEISWLILPALFGLIDRGWRWLAAALCALGVVGIVLSGDRMALVVLLGYGALTALFVGRARRLLLIAAPVAALLVVLLFALDPQLYDREIAATFRAIRDVGDSDYGAIWTSALQVARDHPLFGVGFHNFEAACVDPRYGPLLVGPHQYARCPGHPHNIWLQWLVENGVIGAAMFAIAAVLVLLRLARALPDNRAHLLFVGLFVSLAMRFWPLSTSTSFLSSWSSAPLFLVMGWGLAFASARPYGTAEFLLRTSQASTTSRESSTSVWDAGPRINL